MAPKLKALCVVAAAGAPNALDAAPNAGAGLAPELAAPKLNPLEAGAEAAAPNAGVEAAAPNAGVEAAAPKVGAEAAAPKAAGVEAAAAPGLCLPAM